MDSAFFSLVIYPLTQIIELVFTFCKKLFDNTGIAILGVSAAVSLLTLPLYIVAEHWQQVERDIQKKMKGEVDKIKSVFKGNEQYMILSTYYRQNHYHPIMSLRSAFGLLIQIPFFTAAYTCLSSMTALQGKSFLFIRDMGAPDALFTIGAFTVNVLPIAMTLINMISGTIYTKGLSIRDKVQTYGLALLFVVILYNSPAGLVMYWTMNNLFSLVKNVFYKMKHPVKVLYYIACALVTVFIIWLFAGHILSVKRALLVSFCFALVYPAPLYVKAANHLIDKTFVTLRDSRKTRTTLFALSAVGLSLIVGLLIPSLLIASSPEEFSGIDGFGNPLVFVKNSFVQAAGFFIIWCSLIFFLYKERMQTLIAAALAFLFGSALLNAFVFPGDYGTLSKLLKFTDITNVDSSVFAIILNLTCVLILVAGISAAIKFRLNKYVHYALGLLCVGIIAVTFSNVSKINKGYASYEEKRLATGSTSSELKKIFHFSKTGKNVLYIYLDRAQAQYVEPLFAEHPELNEKLSGFTFYKNTVSFNGHTLLGSPPCFGGYEYTPESMNARSSEKLVDKTNEALQTLPRFFTEQAQGFSATITDPSWANYSWIPDISIFDKYKSQGVSAYLTDGVYTDRWYKDHQDTAQIDIVSASLKRNILWYSFFKVSPLVLRPAFYNDGNYWSTNTANDDYNDYLDGYSVLDYAVSFTDFESPTENSYINLINNTTHDNLFLQAPEYRPFSKVTDFGTSEYAHQKDYHSFAGAMLRVADWLDFLKQNGCYDNTRIVLVADHGANSRENGYEWNEDFERIRPGRYHPLLMFKDFGSTGSLSVSEDFMTNADAPSLLVKGITENPVNPATGKALDGHQKKDGALICLTDIFMPYHNKSDYVFTADKENWYRVSGNIFNSENWKQETQQ
ncbi:YidC/Oxa1 family membrane protein insertase [Treponema sp.]|uniref:YidC/Oxa1 family membrane protein insertase n=1 Tax=Treponema sp. TaxID=166 RepID=UPI003890C5CE